MKRLSFFSPPYLFSSSSLVLPFRGGRSFSFSPLRRFCSLPFPSALMVLPARNSAPPETPVFTVSPSPQYPWSASLPNFFFNRHPFPQQANGPPPPFCEYTENTPVFIHSLAPSFFFPPDATNFWFVFTSPTLPFPLSSFAFPCCFSWAFSVARILLPLDFNSTPPCNVRSWSAIQSGFFSRSSPYSSNFSDKSPLRVKKSYAMASGSD